MKMGSCEGTKQLQQDFIKDDAAGDAAEMAASPFLLFSQSTCFRNRWRGEDQKVNGKDKIGR